MKSNEQYLTEYENILKQTQDEQQRLNELNSRKQMLQSNSINADQILSIDREVNVLTSQLEQLNNQSRPQKNELNELAQNDNNLKQEISSLEKKLKNTKEVTDKCDQAFTDIMVILNGFSAKEGLKLNQAEILIKILPPEELMHTDILKKACEMNHQEEFDKAIEKITNLNFKDSDGKTILMHAIDNGFYYGVDKLLQAGADVNIEDNDKANSLIHCAKTPHIKYMKLIADKTNDINHKGLDGNTAVHFLMQNVRKILFTSELPELDCSNTISFIDYGVQIVFDVHNGKIGGIDTTNIRDSDSYTIVQYKAIKIIKCLSENNANLGLQNNKGETPFFIACIHKLEYLIAQLLKDHIGQLNIDARDVNYNTSLHFASILTNPKLVEPLLKLFDINVTNKIGHTPIVGAVANNAKITVEFLLKLGAKMTTEDGLHILHHASVYGRTDMLKLLRDKVSGIDFPTTILKQSSLWLASQYGHIDSVKWLIEQNADIDFKSSDGFTSIDVASANNRYEVVKFLLEHKASTNIHDLTGTYPIHIGASKGFTDIISLLVNYSDINIRTNNEHKITALYLASQDGELEIVKILANKGADLNIVRASNGMPPLHVSMQKKHLEVAKELLTRGAEVNIVDSYGWIALHWAASLGDVSIATTILGKNTNINAKNSGGGTPLYIAACNNNKPMTELLLSKGADVNIADNNGTYPWHLAAFQGYLEIMQVLKPKILDIDCKTNNIDKYTALWYASQEGRLPTVKWLINNNADVNATQESDGTTALQMAIVNNHLPTVKFLLEDGKADINKTNKDGVSPLYYSLGYFHQAYKLEITKFLLEHNANVHIKSISGGDQPLHRASNLADVAAIKLLLQHGASINEMNKDGSTPLHFLLDGQNVKESNKRLDAIKYLLVKSAKTDIKNEKGESPIDLAKHHFQDAVNFLEHPEQLPSISEFESSITGLTNDFMI